MDFLREIKQKFIDAVAQNYNIEVGTDNVNVGITKSDFEGDFTIVTFPFVKQLQKSPEEIGTTLGTYLVENADEVDSFNVVKGFLNLKMSDKFWQDVANSIVSTPKFGYSNATGKKVLVEFSSPNTNKPLHLGHIRNILLGWSCSRILDACGHEVVKVQIINDRGIAICKSMLAWQKFGNGATPQSSNIKSDHFVGDYYVRFEKEFVEEYKVWQLSPKGIETYQSLKKADQDNDAFFKDYKNTYFNQYSLLGAEAREMLLAWEAGDEQVKDLWRKMNGWVYEGFDKTYKALGVTFDKLYYESDTYLLGKKIIDKGLETGTFYRQEDGSVWVDLEDAGMDRKILLRSDGSSVYMTQDLGTALQRYEDLGAESMIYTVADEQDYHFKVLFEILKRLGEPYAAGLHHLSYGMIDLTTGKMKSREGTVVDADDLIAEVITEARNMSIERGEIAALSHEEQDDILRKIGLAALKFFIIKVQPKKRMVFDPTESVDMQGQTGPYVQNAYVRIQSILRKAGDSQERIAMPASYNWGTHERNLMRHLTQFPSVIKEAGQNYEPSLIANYSYELAKDFHRFYHDVRILNADTETDRQARMAIAQQVGIVLKTAFDLLGIEMPDRM
jgi:arginyl-tRNA synthetase